MINTSVNGIIMEMVKMVRVRKSLDIWHLRDSRDWLPCRFWGYLIFIILKGIIGFVRNLSNKALFFENYLNIELRCI